MKKKLTLLVMVAGAIHLAAQPLQWASPMLGPGGGSGRKMAVDPSGNVYTIGQFSNTVDFDAGPGTTTLASAGNFDAFVTKQDASGSLVWAQRFGDGGADDGAVIAVDPSGDVYTFQSLFTGGSRLVKLSAVSGNTLWSKPTGGTVNSISVDASGNVFLGGAFGGTPDLDPGATVYTVASAGSNDGFITKLDASGNFVWAKTFGGTASDVVLSLALDNSGNIFTTGSFSQTADFDPGAGTFTLSSNGYKDIFVQKLTSAGTFSWAASAGSYLADDVGFSIATDASGNCYVTGNFAGSVDFDPGPGTSMMNATNNGFVWKLDPSGALGFAKNTGGPGINIGLDGTGNIYVSGSIPPVAYDFDPGPGTYTLASTGSNDPFILKLDATGSFVSAGLIGGPGNDVAYHMTTNASGNVFMTGFFNGTADFDPTNAVASYTAPGSSLGYIYTLKLGTGTGTTTAINELARSNDAFVIYPNPCNGMFTLKAIAPFNTVKVYNPSGALILSSEAETVQTTVDMTKEAKGIYFYQVVNNGEVIKTGKLIVE